MIAREHVSRHVAEQRAKAMANRVEFLVIYAGLLYHPKCFKLMGNDYKYPVRGTQLLRLPSTCSVSEATLDGRKVRSLYISDSRDVLDIWRGAEKVDLTYSGTPLTDSSEGCDNYIVLDLRADACSKSR